MSNIKSPEEEPRWLKVLTVILKGLGILILVAVLVVVVGVGIVLGTCMYRKP